MRHDTDRPRLCDLSLPDSDAPDSNGDRIDSIEIDSAELVTLLDDELRRRVLRHLDPEDGTVALSALAERLADDEAVRDQIALRLHHVHLPKLADYGLVSYDSTVNVVSANSIPAWVESHLER